MSTYTVHEEIYETEDDARSYQADDVALAATAHLAYRDQCDPEGERDMTCIVKDEALNRWRVVVWVSYESVYQSGAVTKLTEGYQ